MYTRVEKIVMWLSTFEFMNYKRAKFIVDNYDDLEDLFDNIADYKPELIQIFDIDEYEVLVRERNLYYVEDTMLFEGYSNSFKPFHNSGMVQVVKIGEEYFIGFPTIYSF